MYTNKSTLQPCKGVEIFSYKVYQQAGTTVLDGEVIACALGLPSSLVLAPIKFLHQRLGIARWVVLDDFRREAWIDGIDILGKLGTFLGLYQLKLLQAAGLHKLAGKAM